MKRIIALSLVLIIGLAVVAYANWDDSETVNMAAVASVANSAAAGSGRLLSYGIYTVTNTGDAVITYTLQSAPTDTGPWTNATSVKYFNPAQTDTYSNDFAYRNGRYWRCHIIANATAGSSFQLTLDGRP